MISDKQKQILAFPYTKYDTLICEGAIRTGKTMVMAVAFFEWAMREFEGQNFIIMGKTVGSAWHNVVDPYTMTTWCKRKYKVTLSKSDGSFTLTKGSKSNRFRVFGAKDESSYMLIQGFTAAGCFVDEAAICNESAVNQALARCSVEGSRYWFNCNPSFPRHWFKTKWVDRAGEHNALHIHFRLEDNPSLSKSTVERYERQYTGVFYDRYIRGLWVQAEGIIYGNYQTALEPTYSGPVKDYELSIDYGTMNAFAAQKWVLDNEDVWHCVGEYHYSGRETGTQKTNAAYLRDLVRFTEDAPKGQDVTVYIDPSAASMIAELRNCSERSFRVIPAINDVVDGIADTATCLELGLIKVSDACRETIKEFESYVWDDKASDTPVKENDHHMDAIRYFVYSKALAKREREYQPVFG